MSAFGIVEDLKHLAVAQTKFFYNCNFITFIKKITNYYWEHQPMTVHKKNLR